MKQNWNDNWKFTKDKEANKWEAVSIPHTWNGKDGQALAGGLSGWALGWIGYNSSAVAQTDAVAKGIYGLSTFFPGAVFIACGLVLWFIYPLGKKRVEANVAELEKRRNN